MCVECVHIKEMCVLNTHTISIHLYTGIQEKQYYLRYLCYYLHICHSFNVPKFYSTEIFNQYLLTWFMLN